MSEPFPLPPRELPVGVYVAKSGRYYAYITYRVRRLRVQKHLGTFGTVEAAHAARKQAEHEMKEQTA